MSRVPSIAAPRGGASLMVAWRLDSRKVLVIGGGPVAAGRVRLALEADARVQVVSPTLNAELKGRARRDEIVWSRRAWETADLEGADMVLACLDDAERSRSIAQLCRQRRIPVNAADRPELCDFWFPAVHREGPVQIAVSTGGNGPALAARLRDHLAEALPPRVSAAVERFGALRKRLRPLAPTGHAPRMSWLREVGQRLPWSALASLNDDGVEAMGQAFEARASAGPAGPAPQAVRLVGAGPGDPELLTLAARRSLQEADLVLADRLVPNAILALVRGELRIASKRPGRADPAQAELQSWMLEGALQGRSVVRLKCGDPYLLGRGGEEVDFLASHGVPTEVLPGVTSALSAPLAAGIPATQRHLADRVLISTGQGSGGRSPVLPPFDEDLTVVLLMAVGRLEALVTELQSQGWPADWPAAVIERASQPGEQVVTACLAEIAQEARRTGVRAPATFVLGRVASKAHAASGAAEAVAEPPLRGALV